MWASSVACLVCACGRIGFDPGGDAVTDHGASPDDNVPMTMLTVSAEQLMSSGTNSDNPHVEAAGSEIGLTWLDRAAGTVVVYRQLGESGPLSGEGVVNNNGTSGVGRLAWTGTDYAIAFYDTGSSEPGPWLARITPSGQITRDKRVVAGPAIITGEVALAAGGGGSVALVWSAGGTLYFQSWDANDNVLANAVPIDDALTASSITWDGISYVVAYAAPATVAARINVRRVGVHGQLGPVTQLMGQ